MKTRGMNRAMRVITGLLALGGLAFGAPPARQEGRIAVAVAVADLEPIVRAVGGAQVETLTLLKGCILRADLRVEPALRGRLATAEAIVWTGFLNESAAITADLRSPGAPARKGAGPKWIDVSRGTARTSLPTSTCSGYVDPAFASGDPFFWLNPENGGLIARHIARGLGELRPASRAHFLANAEAFQSALAKDITRWKAALKPLHGLRVFSAQCGWQNFASMGGPEFLPCKGIPGELPSPQALLLQVKQMKADFILVDPNTPAEYAEAFRERSHLKVAEVPSSIEALRGASTYSALFDNLVRTLQGLGRP